MKSHFAMSHFSMMADYNTWANKRLYRMASQLSDDAYRRDVGAFFKSLHGTLNHILVADLIWLHRLTGAGTHPTNLNAIVFDDLASLSTARQETDLRIESFVKSLSDAQFEETCEYRTLAQVAQKGAYREILAHVFNHQTHHRGQAHTILTLLGVAEPEGLDLLLMQRER